MSLATVPDLKTYLNIQTATITADAELQRMLDMASALVESYVERSLMSGSRTEVRSGYGTDRLLLSNYPVTAVSAVTINGAAVALSTGTTNPTTGYMFDDKSIYLINKCFDRGRNNITVAYTAGYATLPADIYHAVLETAAQAYREKDWIGFSSKGLAGETVAFVRGGIPDSARFALNPYRRMHACD